MKYYIVGKQTKNGDLESDTLQGNLNEYFELGWEYACTHLHIKHLFSTNKLESDDVIVTLKDRMFFYEGFWNNVLNYDEFIKMEVDLDNVVDLCNMVEVKRNLLPRLNSLGEYEYWESDKEVIKNIKYKNIDYLDTKKPFCCLHIRYRIWADHRNFSEKFWENVIKKIKKSNINIFIFGKESKKFADNKTIFHVNLDEYASLLNNPNCLYLIGNMSGGTLVGQLFSHKNCINYVIIADQQTYNEFNTTGPYEIFYHKENFNFSKCPINHIFLENEKDDKLNDFLNII